MASVGDILSDDDFLDDVVDTPKEGAAQNKKREELKSQTRVSQGVNGHMKGQTRPAMKPLGKRMLNTGSVN